MAEAGLVSDLHADQAADLPERWALVWLLLDHREQQLVELGRQVLEKYGEKREVIHAMECHHGDYDPTTVEAVLVRGYLGDVRMLGCARFACLPPAYGNRNRS